MKNVVEERENGRRRVLQHTEGPSLTEQSHAENLSIKDLVERSTRTGTMPMQDRAAMYGDFSEVTDFHTAQNMIIEARERFMRLPAKIRKRFRNDPGELLRFLENPANLAEAVELGLADPQGVAAPISTAVASEEPGEASEEES